MKTPVGSDIARAEQSPDSVLPRTLPGPRGIGLGVAFDWAIVVELVALALARVAGAPSLAGSGAGHLSGAAYILALLVAAMPPFLLGEGLRRGRRWAWLIQVAANSAGTVGGLLTIPGTLDALRSGDAWPLILTAILVLMSPFIVWRLTRPVTRAWLARVSSSEARRRHGGLWLAQTWAGCAIGGIAVALSVMFG